MGEHDRSHKPGLRRRILATRGQRSPAEIATASRAICTQVLALTMFQIARALVAYAARPDEIDPSILVESGLRSGRTVHFPRLDGPALGFLAGSPSDLRPGTHGILEPRSPGPVSSTRGDVLFLAPGLSFDPCGRRLGRGGGHYDRALAGYPRGFRLGLAMDADLSPALPGDTWDEPVDVIVTENRLLWSAARPAAVCKEILT
jgi:5-formyltetrahydrofolate cyclo-ligase